jgi:CheY-like chemotaxis protein
MSYRLPSELTSATTQLTSVLVVDADSTARRMVVSALRTVGYSSVALDNGAACIEGLQTIVFDVLLVDYVLPDMSGVDLIRVLHQHGRHVPFVMSIGTASIRATVEAMRLGAVDVIEKPLVIEDLVAAVRTAVHVRAMDAAKESARSFKTHGRDVPLARSGSAAARWAALAVRACDADQDLKTLHDWAAYAGVSYTSLREICRLVSIPPHDARDFVRLLRAVICSQRADCPPAVLLDVSDRRTLTRLLQRAGLGSNTSPGPVSLPHFFDQQCFVPRDNEGLRILRRYLTGRS